LIAHYQEKVMQEKTENGSKPESTVADVIEKIETGEVKREPAAQLELEIDGEGDEAHAIIAMVENRFVYKKETQRETSSEEVVAIVQFEGPIAKVRRGYGLTLNLSNYESARVDVGIEVPCYLVDVDVADEWARKWVERRMVQEVENVRGKGSTNDKPRY
jgi:hypothetical protein